MANFGDFNLIAGAGAQSSDNMDELTRQLGLLYGTKPAGGKFSHHIELDPFGNRLVNQNDPGRFAQPQLPNKPLPDYTKMPTGHEFIPYPQMPADPFRGASNQAPMAFQHTKLDELLGTPPPPQLPPSPEDAKTLSDATKQPSSMPLPPQIERGFPYAPKNLTWKDPNNPEPNTFREMDPHFQGLSVWDKSKQVMQGLNPYNPLRDLMTAGYVPKEQEPVSSELHVPQAQQGAVTSFQAALTAMMGAGAIPAKMAFPEEMPSWSSIFAANRPGPEPFKWSQDRVNVLKELSTQFPKGTPGRTQALHEAFTKIFPEYGGTPGSLAGKESKMNLTGVNIDTGASAIPRRELFNSQQEDTVKTLAGRPGSLKDKYEQFKTVYPDAEVSYSSFVKKHNDFVTRGPKNWYDKDRSGNILSANRPGGPGRGNKPNFSDAQIAQIMRMKDMGLDQKTLAQRFVQANPDHKNTSVRTINNVAYRNYNQGLPPQQVGSEIPNKALDVLKGFKKDPSKLLSNYNENDPTTAGILQLMQEGSPPGVQKGFPAPNAGDVGAPPKLRGVLQKFKDKLIGRDPEDPYLSQLPPPPPPAANKNSIVDKPLQPTMTDRDKYDLATVDAYLRKNGIDPARVDAKDKFRYLDDPAFKLFSNQTDPKSAAMVAALNQGRVKGIRKATNPTPLTFDPKGRGWWPADYVNKATKVDPIPPKEYRSTDAQKYNWTEAQQKVAKKYGVPMKDIQERTDWFEIMKALHPDWFPDNDSRL